MARSRTAYALVSSLVILIIAGCGGQKVLVPPRLELGPQTRVGLPTFTIENAKGGLHEFATERFAEHILSAQPGTEVLELGAVGPTDGTNGGSGIDAEWIRSLGETHDVPALFLGHLVVSNAKPRASILDGSGFDRASLAADVKVTLSVRLVSTESGATLWRSSAWAQRRIAELGLLDGDPYFAARDPNEAYGELVDALIYEATRDLRPTWVKR